MRLTEFMEHDVEALPISLSILAELAQVRVCIQNLYTLCVRVYNILHPTYFRLIFLVF